MKKLILLLILTLTMMIGQTDVTQKVFNIDVPTCEFVSLSDILPNYNLDWALINLLDCENSNQNYCRIEHQVTDGQSMTTLTKVIGGTSPYYRSDNNNISQLYTKNDGMLIFSSINGGCGIENYTILITAEFPQEDTGYIEDGFDYCVEPGANLMSYPCDSSVALLDAIPSDALSSFEGIIGAGEAATNLNGTWVGSITNLTPGSGYWIKSNTALCFNYDCSEN
jgi:hypothetical protein